MCVQNRLPPTRKNSFTAPPILPQQRQKAKKKEAVAPLVRDHSGNPEDWAHEPVRGGPGVGDPLFLQSSSSVRTRTRTASHEGSHRCSLLLSAPQAASETHKQWSGEDREQNSPNTQGRPHSMRSSRQARPTSFLWVLVSGLKQREGGN